VNAESDFNTARKGKPMRICRVTAGNEQFYAVLEKDKLKRISGTPFERHAFTGRTYSPGEYTLLAPCVPSKVVAVGLNYRGHAKEMGDELPAEPKIFLKPATSVIGPEMDILMPPQSQRVDYEAELAVVIGRTCRTVSSEDAMAYVLGFTCLNDVTARDLQKRDGQWTRAKSFDTFCPIGPWIETEMRYDNAAVISRLNGKVCQQSRTSDLIFNIGSLVSFISGVMTLLPGDVIATGTPAGIGPMADGDAIEIEVEGVGVLRNTARMA
jgi:2-keto-4-pentenoate hydratase/2-oxohepta-3-ene-1,7-dioic acid hydratase in catechol pathway